MSGAVEIRPGAGAPQALVPAARRLENGHGTQLLEAFTALERFPALGHSHARLLDTLRGPDGDAGAVVATIESDAALAIRVLREANSDSRGVDSVADAVARLGMPRLARLFADVPVFDFFGRTGTWGSSADRFRVHGLATQRAARRLIREGICEAPNRVRTAAVLHDVGKLVLSYTYGRTVPDRDGSPRDRLEAERDALGVDHASVGGVLVRRLGLPSSLASLVENHHAEEASGDAAVLRLADLLAHYYAGDCVDSREMSAAGARAGLDPAQLRDVLSELPDTEALPRYVSPSPLSSREAAVLVLLARGWTYKQIAAHLGRSPSTVRTHLANVYRKLGVVDRAQAVLLAKDRGWL